MSAIPASIDDALLWLHREGMRLALRRLVSAALVRSATLALLLSGCAGGSFLVQLSPGEVERVVSDVRRDDAAVCAGDEVLPFRTHSVVPHEEAPRASAELAFEPGPIDMQDDRPRRYLAFEPGRGGAPSLLPLGITGSVLGAGGLISLLLAGGQAFVCAQLPCENPSWVTPVAVGGAIGVALGVTFIFVGAFVKPETPEPRTPRSLGRGTICYAD